MERQQIKQQKQITAYEKQVTYDLLLMSIEWLEKHIEVVHKNEFPDWKERKQIHGNNIKRTDINGNPEMVKDSLSTQLLLLETNLRRRPEFIREEIKGEYYKWISATGINCYNCPEKLKQLLFGINEILEGRGEKIRKEVETERPVASVEEMKDLFVYSHLAAKEEDKTQKVLLNKTYRDVKIGGKFESGSVEEGKETFKQIARNVSDHQNFHYFPSQEQNNTPKLLDTVARQDFNRNEIIVTNNNGQEETYYSGEGTETLTEEEIGFASRRAQELHRSGFSQDGELWVVGGGLFLIASGGIINFFGRLIKRP